jgi:hypothetical protein
LNVPERRCLVFESIEAIMPDVDRLIAGHVTVGRWTLGAICDHLARTIDLTLNTAATDVPATREQAIYRRLFFRAAVFPEGQTIPLESQEPATDADVRTSAEELRGAVARLALHDGGFATHPMLGAMTREQWLLFHARHAAHHLSFAVPV